MGFWTSAAHAVENFFGANKPAFDAVTGAAPIASNPQVVTDIPTRAEFAYQQAGKDYNSPFGDGLPSAKENLSNFNFYGHYGSDISGAAGVPVSDQYDYYNAKLASIYGMDAETAYREALSNTSYQRAVEDLKAAGLNPTLLAGKVSGADTFYGALDAGSSGGSSGASGGVSGLSGGSAKGNSLSLKGALKDHNVRSGISSVVSGITMAATRNFQAGAAGYYFTNALLNAVSKR